MLGAATAEETFVGATCCAAKRSGTPDGASLAARSSRRMRRRPPVASRDERRPLRAGDGEAAAVHDRRDERRSSRASTSSRSTRPATRANVALAVAGAKATASSTYPSFAIHKLAHVNDGRSATTGAGSRNETARGGCELEFPEPVEIDRVVWGRDREEKFKDRLATRLPRSRWRTRPGEWKVVASGDRPAAATRRTGSVRRVYALADAPTRKRGRAARRCSPSARGHEQQIGEPEAAEPMVYAGTFAPARPTHRLHRGDPMQPKEEVDAGRRSAPSARGSTCPPTRRAAAPAEAGRVDHRPGQPADRPRDRQPHLALPLRPGPRRHAERLRRQRREPTHPELLDWLATEFVAQRLELKPIHRLIVLLGDVPAVERRPARTRWRVDAAHALLWRFPPRRLEAEAIRDAMLAVSGKLDLAMGGPGFSRVQAERQLRPRLRAEGESGPAEWRRMVYTSKIRSQQDATFGAFDCPDGGQIAPKRTEQHDAAAGAEPAQQPVHAPAGGLLRRAAEVARQGGTPAQQVRPRFRSRSAGRRRRRARRRGQLIARARPAGVLPRAVQRERVRVRALSRSPWHGFSTRASFEPRARCTGYEPVTRSMSQPLSNTGRRLLDRRSFLRNAARGLGGIALANLLAAGPAARRRRRPAAPIRPLDPPRRAAARRAGRTSRRRRSASS